MPNLRLCTKDNILQLSGNILKHDIYKWYTQEDFRLTIQIQNSSGPWDSNMCQLTNAPFY